MAINFRGKEYRQSKQSPNNPRTIAPEEAFEKMLPFLKEIGVTRFPNLTGLNRSGIPCVNAIRPDIKNPSVSHGKGLTVASAMASAAGEAAERYHCFNIRPPSIECSYSELQKKYRVIHPERLQLSKNSLFNIHKPEFWTFGWDIIHQEEVAVPLELVYLGGVYSDPVNQYSFQCTSNGISAGLDFLESLSQAMYEVFERDAIACNDMLSRAQGSELPLNRVRLESIEFPVVRNLFERMESADILPLLFDCTVDTEVPTYACYTIDRLDPRPLMALGMGASLDPETAMVRAVTEAIQADVALHSGTRDLSYRDGLFYSRLYGVQKYIDIYYANEGSAHTGKSEMTNTFEDDIMRCIDKLKSLNLDQFIVLDLTVPDFPGAIVKVIIPGLEGYSHTPVYSPGYRALEYSKK